MKATFDKETIIYGRGLIAAGEEVDMSEKDLRPHLGRRARLGWDLPPLGADNASDAAVALAQENGIDLSEVEGTGKDGKIVKGDVLALVGAEGDD